MGKKQKKLTEEEIEEYRNGTYQMMAAMSGKPISELMGESPSRPNYDENYCLTKQMYLKNCAEPISSRQLYELLQKQGYKAKYSTYRGLLNNYMKYGYIKKVNAKKPFLYILTDKGKLHVKNPFIAVDENIQRYRNMLLQKMKELIEGQPELFKSIYESIFGAQPVINTVVAGGTSYTPNNYSDDIIHEIENKIYSNDFWKNSDNEKLKSLVDGILDPCLTQEEKQELLIDAFSEAVKSNKTMVFKQQEYNSSKPIGQRHYYEYLVSAVDKLVTKPLYEKIPFRFIRVGNELRLKSRSESGIYQNNKDANELDFDYVNRQYFQNRMMIKKIPNNEKREHDFYYANGNFGRKITTISFDDFDNVKGKPRSTLKIKSSQSI